ncbi:uncharacterized protein [Heterodontus francisci]|uniref:uncharacterized protein n=1 Tax=Heterodontus francisci TaxID=7792 RepID=UPI00355B5762
MSADNVTKRQHVDMGYSDKDGAGVGRKVIAADSIRKDASIRGVTIPGSGGTQVKTSLYMDDVAVFCSDPLSVRRLMSICGQFELASGAKVNHGKSEAMFFGNWADRSFVPFTVRSDYLKVLGIWFGRAGACTKTWEERVAKVRQKLGMWGQRSLYIVSKNLVIRCEALTMLLYVVQVWPIPHSCAVAVTRAIFRFVWGSKMDRVRRDTMFKSLDMGGKNVPNVALILMTTFVCGCIKLCVDPQYANSKCHYLLRFYLSPVFHQTSTLTLQCNPSQHSSANKSPADKFNCIILLQASPPLSKSIGMTWLISTLAQPIIARESTAITSLSWKREYYQAANSKENVRSKIGKKRAFAGSEHGREWTDHPNVVISCPQQGVAGCLWLHANTGCDDFILRQEEGHSHIPKWPLSSSVSVAEVSVAIQHLKDTP